MSELLPVPDLDQRARALDPQRSFIVQAPAGSGKTELLIQRCLALLGSVGRPEEIAAITFTIKAAAEMRNRVFEALRSARHEARPEAAHHARTWDLARAALERNDALGWKLEESADRLRVQTIDALCASLTRQMPVLSRFGAQPESIEDASAMYAQAARNLIEALESPDDDAAADLARLLRHLDNNAAEAEKLLADMLMRRDHWIRTLRGASDRAALERALAEVRGAAVAHVRELWPESLAAPGAGDIGAWIDLAGDLLTTTGQWRKRHATAQMLAGNDLLCEALGALQSLPPAAYTAEQWDALETIVRLAPRAIGELQLVFAQRGQADFVEISQGALRALEDEHGPTDLLLALDYRIRHILVDEFQDTSMTQFELLEKLTSGWEDGDGRTLFVVGDPMQSIYRFREAEVGRFLQAWRRGIGDVALETLTLSANFRSQAGIVAWVNENFARLMPQAEDIHSGAVRYSASQAVHPAEAESVVVHPFFDDDRAGEGRRVAQIVAAALAQPGLDGGPASVAILVRSRSHLLEVLPRLREAGLAFRAIEIEPLGHRPVVQDLLALTRALSHLADRTAWLAVLRAPWCALTLADLSALCGVHEEGSVWSAMNAAASREVLSSDGRERMLRTRAVLERALANRRRSSLRSAVEGAWLALGGPACVENATDLEDAEIYLDHLESAEEAGTIPDLGAFEAAVAGLFALPDLDASERLQVMTIHKAKGLEFDTVIVPGLDSGTGRDDRKLFMWMETPGSSLLLAPINATGAEDDPIYTFIRRLDRSRTDHENARLLYVAATRAKRRLHLLGCAKLGHHDEAQEPTKGSLLAKLWPVLAGEFRPPEERAAAPAAARSAAPSQGALRRLAIGTFTYELPPPASWVAPPETRARDEVEFSWVGDSARRVGAVVHRWLQRIAEDEARGWTRARIEAERATLRKELAARGIAQSGLDAACERAVSALTGSLEDSRGRWLLGPQRNARNEYRVSTWDGAVRRMLVIDRMFEDVEGRTWIVDHKTSSHEGADLERFLAAEEDRYREQLERYAGAVGKVGARRALYFPLLKGWREWG